jgi:hypothetical protein
MSSSISSSKVIGNLDEGLFYIFMIFSAYMVKEAFIQFNIEATRNHTKLNYVDNSTQTCEEEIYDNEYEEEIQNIEFCEATPKQVVKKKYLWFV